MSFCKRERGVKSRKDETSEECQRRHMRIGRREGLQLRAAAALSSVAAGYQCKVRVYCEHRRADATSIIELLCLAAGAGSEVVLEAAGPDAVQALDRVEHLIRHEFDVNA